MVILVTGRPGAGKTHYAHALVREYGKRGIPASVLDGDEVRAETDNRNFTDDGRERHLITMAEMASQYEKHGVVAIISAVAPKRAWRDKMRSLWRASMLVYIPGGTLWEGTKYEVPSDDEF